MRIYKERRLYFASSCEGCGNRYQSFKRAKIKHGLCRKCRSKRVEPGQDGLFSILPLVEEPLHRLEIKSTNIGISAIGALSVLKSMKL